MRHSFTIILIISSLWLTKLYAQTSEPFMNHTWSIGVGNMTLHDSYLSPASYSGLNLNLNIAESAFYKNCDERREKQKRNRRIANNADSKPIN